MSCSFNPYLVPGWPMLILDNSTMAHSLVATCLGVTHEMSGDMEAWTTVAQFGHADYLGDYLAKLYVDRLEEGYGGKALIAAPGHPVQSIREGTQIWQAIDQIYSRLFYKSRGMSWSAFNPMQDLYAVTRGVEEDLDTLFGTYKKVGEMTREILGESLKKADNPYIFSGLWEASELNNEAYSVREHLENAMNDYDSALKYIARPVCTLDEFMEANPGTKAASPIKVEPTSAEEGRGASYYKKILDFEQGPGPAPTIDPKTGIATVKITAQTRDDWDKILSEFRSRVIRKVMPK